MNAVVVHDGAVHPGGAVKVVIETARALDGDIVVGISAMDEDWWNSRVPNDAKVLSKKSKMGTIQDLKNAYRMMNLSLNEYDVVVTSGPATKFFQPYDNQTHVHYLHHPPLSKLWFEGGLSAYLQSFVDRVETRSIPVIIANSRLTAERCWKHYGREVSRVVNPPVEVESFSGKTDRQENKFVMVGRLEERKRPRLAVQAFTELQDSEISPRPELHLVGGGPDLQKIKKEASDNIVVHGFVDDEELRSIVESAYGGVFLAKREDFGLTPVEYLAAGLPVLGVDEPNTNNQIQNEEQGVLVEPDVESVKKGVVKMIDKPWDRENISATVDQYGINRFQKEIQEAVKDA
ncbi:glycosyltransferase [Halomicrococcus gelatinilyticus]|uniref:glycosyltransferase n=1 Tax=Halomicrococcus gelatinilyticus TaxID=1702103 RepID=UPI002E13F17A